METETLGTSQECQADDYAKSKVTEEHKYLIKYMVETGEYTKEELRSENCGGCDQLGLISVMGDFLNGESLSLNFIGVKGKDMTTSWNDEEWFEVFSMMSHNLNNSETLDPEKVAIAKEAFEKIREIKLRKR